MAYILRSNQARKGSDAASLRKWALIFLTAGIIGRVILRNKSSCGTQHMPGHPQQVGRAQPGQVPHVLSQHRTHQIRHNHRHHTDRKKPRK